MIQLENKKTIWNNIDQKEKEGNLKMTLNWKAINQLVTETSQNLIKISYMIKTLPENDEQKINKTKTNLMKHYRTTASTTNLKYRGPVLLATFKILKTKS